MKTTQILLPLQRLAAIAAVLVCIAGLSRSAEASSPPQFTFTNLQSLWLAPVGANPEASLTLASDRNFYGTTSVGGTNGGYGTIFKVTTNGIGSVLYSFSGEKDGENLSSGLLQGSDGNFYGTARYGGANRSGSVFKVTTNGALTTLCSFNYTNGAYPEAGLVEGTDGNFYGTTSGGGLYTNYGTVFKMTTNGILTTLCSFEYTNGAYPESVLTPSGSSTFYGTTSGGGTNGDNGTIFQITTSGTLNTLSSFDYANGADPQGALVEGGNSNWYGTTEAGGAYDDGTVFQITPAGTISSLYSFDSAFGYQSVAAGLVQDDNEYYGVTTYGGDRNQGVLFEVTTNGTLQSLHYFSGGSDGSNPRAALAQGGDGNFYGTASHGGVGNGTVFRITPSGTFEPVYEFPVENDALAANPLVHGSDGNFYGTSQNGGTNGGNGNVFKIATNGALTSLYSFTGNNDGGTPVAALVEGSDGNYYGTSQYGGAYGNGTVFSVSTSGALTTLYAFTGGSDGANPGTALAEGPDGNFYGSTTGFNTTGLGTIFQVSPAGELTTLYSFTGQLDGTGTGGLVLGQDGNFYGTSPDGGTNFTGAFFVMSPEGGLTVLYSFTDGYDGGNPAGSLVVGGDGNFYGSTTEGGDYGAGTVFQMTPDGSWNTLYSFEGYYDGESPSTLLAGTDGKFYGTTPYGGIDFDGSVFELTPDGALTTIYSFTGGDDGGYPVTSLVQGSDGSLFGTTTEGAPGGNGGFFRISGSTLPSPLPLITMQPENEPATLTGLAADFTVNALGGAPLNYEWKQNGVPLSDGDEISGANLGILTVDPVSSGDAGTYSVVISNSYGVIVSSNATLSVLADTNAAEDFESGTNYISVDEFVLANLSFANALAFSPTNGMYNFFSALSGVLSLPQEPAGSNFLNRLGIGDIGRDIFNWRAEEPTNADGRLEVPDTTPPLNADEFTAQLRTNVLPAIVEAENNLAQITATNFTVQLTTNETHASAVTVDWGDVQMLQAMGNAAELFIYTTYSWNLNAQLNTVTNSFLNNGGLEAILTNYPSLLTTVSTSDLPAARGAFTNAISNYFASSQFIRNRPEGEIRLFNLDPEKAKEELQFRQTLSNLLASLSGPVTLTINPAYKVSAEEFFSGNFSPRSYLPQFEGNDFVWDTFPDTNFGGVFTGATETQIGQRILKHIESILDVPGTSVSVVYDFTNFSDQTGVVSGSDGTLYGTMTTGGPYINDDPNGLGFGSVFKITSAGQFSILYKFGARLDNGNPLDGYYPNALTLGNDGNLYGTTVYGGTNSSGTIFKITPAGQLTTLHSFNTAGDDYATIPAAALAQGADGRFYGTTEYGGANNSGTIFAISTNGVLANLYSFSGGNDGGYPVGAPLVQTTNSGTPFFGTTPYGGENGYGTIFKITPSTPGEISGLYSFGTQEDEDGDPLDGAIPNGLAMGSDGNLYGTTEYGGINDDFLGFYGYVPFSGYGAGDGTLFRISPTKANSFQTIVSFDENFGDGYYPIGALVAGPPGTLCGIASAGGGDKKGAVFLFNTNGSASNIVWLTKSTGCYSGNFQLFASFQPFFISGDISPVPSFLAPGPGGNLYGTTTDGGANGDGTVYELSLSGLGAAAMPVIQSVTHTSESIQFTWSTTPASTYQVQYKTNLAQSAWANLGSTTNATGTTLSTTDSLTNSREFYRIELVQ